MFSILVEKKYSLTVCVISTWIYKESNGPKFTSYMLNLYNEASNYFLHIMITFGKWVKIFTYIK